MRDTLALRTRIAVLACLPGLAACSSPAEPAAERQGKPPRPSRTVKELPAAERDQADHDADEADAKQAKIQPARKVVAVPAGQSKANQPTPPAVASPSQGSHATPMGPVPGDPPFIDGYNPEEDTCISGNWCGAGPAAAAVAVPNVPEELGCAVRIAGGKASETIKGDPKTYEGLSAAPNMQGALNQHGTELARAKGGDDVCCYHWFEYCSGRPHLSEHGPVLAPVQPAGGELEGWCDPTLAEDRPDPLASSPALRARVAAAWLDDARAEHASVAAFARATLELMAVGAPPSLLAQAQQAGLDEIEHARACFGLAARYGGEAMRPGPLPALPPRPADPCRLAADTFAEGCVGETIAALAARRAARGATDPLVAAALERIADDEARHAALAWSTVAWARAEGGAAVAEHLRRVAASLRPSDDEALPPEEPEATQLRAHGRLDARAHALAGRQAWAEIIAPMLEQLLAEPRREHPQPTHA